MATETFVEVSSDCVPDRTREAAHNALRACCKVLNLPKVRIYWVAVATAFDVPPEMGGRWEMIDSDERAVGFVTRAGPEEMFIKTGRPLRQTVQTVVHEARHLWQFRNDFAADQASPALLRQEQERDANQFAEMVVSIWFD